jgi:hypothetical protein
MMLIIIIIASYSHPASSSLFLTALEIRKANNCLVLQELNGAKEPILAVAGPAEDPADVRSAERSGSSAVTSREVHCTGGNQSDGDKVGNSRTGSLYRNLKQQGIFPRRTVCLVLFVA